jgi:CHASE2 domain-containing sensor protein
MMFWRRRLVLLLLTACIVALVVFQGRSSALLTFTSSPPELDQVHGIAVGLGLMPTPTLPVTLVSIDDETFSSWGRPFPMSKKRLIPLIEAARLGGARSVILDIDLSTDSGAADTATLHSYLSTWPVDAPELLLPRELTVENASGIVSEQPTPYDEIVGDKGNVAWINVLFSRSEDLKLRDWNLWEIPEGACAALMAPQLLLQLKEQGEGAESIEAIGHYLAHREKADCPAVSLGTATQWAQEVPRSAPLQFTFGYRDQSVSVQMVETETGTVPALMQWSGLKVQNGQVSTESFRNRHVIIGASHNQSGDFHDTPAGEMEGMRVLANAIANSAAIKETVATSSILIDFAGVVLGGVIAWAFVRLKAVIAGLATFVMAVGVYALAARIFGAVAAHEVIARAAFMAILAGALVSIKALLEDWLLRRRGWRSLLGD